MFVRSGDQDCMLVFIASSLVAMMLVIFKLTASSVNISLVGLSKDQILHRITLYYSCLFFFCPFLAVDLTYGVVCCFQCGDYVYDRELEIIAQKHQTKASHSLGLGEVFHSWEPSEEEIELLKKHPRRKKITDSSIIGQ